tara:strand:- start:329 stop:589 length:261 start_codon:yes stop_codon:yes gene_type:complete
MKLTEVTVARSVKVNMGNYEATDFFVSMKAEPEGDEKSLDVTKALNIACERSLLIDLRRLYKASSTQLSDREIAARHGLGTILEKK